MRNLEKLVAIYGETNFNGIRALDIRDLYVILEYI